MRLVKGRTDVCFGSQADICSATADVRFTPNKTAKANARKGHVCSAPKADMCGATAHVR